jgi:RNA polymerase sigma factor (sigma-70 family)
MALCNRRPSGLEPAVTGELIAITRASLGDIRHSRLLCHDAEDLEQDALLALLVALAAGKRPVDLLALARKVTRDLRCNYFRKRARRTRRRRYPRDEEWEGVADRGPEPGTALACRDDVETALARVTEEVRVVVVEVRVNGRPQAEVAGELGRSRQWVQRVLAGFDGSTRTLRASWEKS